MQQGTIRQRRGFWAAAGAAGETGHWLVGRGWARVEEAGAGGKVQPKDAIPSVDVFCKVNVVKECRTIFLKARCLYCDLATILSILKSERLGSPARLPPISVIH